MCSLPPACPSGRRPSSTRGGTASPSVLPTDSPSAEMQWTSTCFCQRKIPDHEDLRRLSRRATRAARTTSTRIRAHRRHRPRPGGSRTSRRSRESSAAGTCAPRTAIRHHPQAAVGDASSRVSSARRQWMLATPRWPHAACRGQRLRPSFVLVYGVNWLMRPRSAATLEPTAAAGAGSGGEFGRDRWVVVSSEEGLFADVTIDRRTLTPYGTFRGVEVWAADDELDNPCLILIEESSQQTLQAVCTPRSGDLIADVGAWTRLDHDFADELAAGTVLRFQHRGTTIDALRHPLIRCGEVRDRRPRGRA